MLRMRLPQLQNLPAKSRPKQPKTTEHHRRMPRQRFRQCLHPLHHITTRHQPALLPRIRHGRNRRPPQMRTQKLRPSRAIHMQRRHIGRITERIIPHGHKSTRLHRQQIPVIPRCRPSANMTDVTSHPKPHARHMQRLEFRQPLARAIDLHQIDQTRKIPRIRKAETLLPGPGHRPRHAVANNPGRPNRWFRSPHSQDSGFRENEATPPQPRQQPRIHLLRRLLLHPM